MTNDTELKELGSGGINTVYELDKDNKVDDHKDKKRVLKRGHEFVDFSNGGEATVFERTRLMKTEAIDTSEAYAMNTSYRDVAVSLMDRLFHLNAAVKTTFARAENGDQASLMHKAKGSDVFHSYAYMDDKGKRRAGIMKQILINEVFLSKGVDPKTLHKRENDDAHNAYVDKVNAGIRDAQKRGMVNINSAAFLESTYNLAALDYIVGHVDRHAGNIMMTESGVQGIDNDSAFSLRVKGGELGSETKNTSAAQMVKYARDSKGAGGAEIGILGEYVNRLTGFKKGRENNKKVVFYLFKALEKRAEAGDFDLYDEIKNGNLDKMVEEIKQKVEAEENT